MLVQDKPCPVPLCVPGALFSHGTGLFPGRAEDAGKGPAGPFPIDLFMSGLCRVIQWCFIVLGSREQREVLPLGVFFVFLSLGTMSPIGSVG